MSVVAAGVYDEPTVAVTPHEVRREKLKYIQTIRVIAIMLVVATHCRDPFLAGDVVQSRTFLLLMRSINLVFIFVSGFLFQYLADRFEYRSYLKTKVRNVVLPYLVCSIPAIAMYVVGIKQIANLGGPASIDTLWEALPFMVLTGTHLTPFWFIPVMGLYYLAAPLFLTIDRRPHRYLVLAPLLVVSLIVSRAPGDTNPLHNALFYLPVYLGGMAVSRFRAEIIPFLGKWYPLFFLGMFLPLPIEGTGMNVNGVYLCSKILVCLAILGALYRWVREIPGWIIRIGDMSFGVFFVHYYIVAAIMMLRPKLGITIAGLPMYLLICVVVMGLSLQIVYLAQRVAGRYSRSLIGA